MDNEPINQNDSLDFTDIIRGGIKLAQANLGTIIKAVIVPYLFLLGLIVGVLLFMVLLSSGAAGSDFGSQFDSFSIGAADIGSLITLGGFLLILFLFVAYVLVRIQAGLSRVLLQSYRKKQKYTFRQVWTTGKNYWGPMVVVSFLVGLVVIAGLVALVIPGIIAIFLLVLAPIAVVDNFKGVDALRRSKDLVKGNLSVVFVLIVIYFALSAVPSIFGDSSAADALSFVISLSLSVVSPAILVVLYESLAVEAASNSLEQPSHQDSNAS